LTAAATPVAGRDAAMPKEIWIALFLVLVFEGLFLFAAPEAWQRMARQLIEMEARQLRVGGAIAVVAGLLLLQLLL
jgi:uncharacterized protein YjeT (DUF2065 family)